MEHIQDIQGEVFQDWGYGILCVLQAYKALLGFMIIYYLVFIGNFQVILIEKFLRVEPAVPQCPAVPSSLLGRVPVDQTNRSWAELEDSLAEGTPSHFTNQQ